LRLTNNGNLGSEDATCTSCIRRRLSHFDQASGCADVSPNCTGTVLVAALFPSYLFFIPYNSNLTAAYIRVIHCAHSRTSTFLQKQLDCCVTYTIAIALAPPAWPTTPTLTSALTGHHQVCPPGGMFIASAIATTLLTDTAPDLGSRSGTPSKHDDPLLRTLASGRALVLRLLVRSRKYYFVQISTGVSTWETPTTEAPTVPTPGTTPAQTHNPYAMPQEHAGQNGEDGTRGFGGSEAQQSERGLGVRHCAGCGHYT